MDGGAPSEGSPNPSASPDSRQRLVNAAVDLTLEHYAAGTGVRDAFAFLTPGAVAARAGLSRALIYHHWGGSENDPDSFAQFLTSVAGELWQLPSASMDLLSAAATLPRNRSDLIRGLSDLELERVTGKDRATMRASEALTLHGMTPESVAEEVVSRLAEIYRGLGEYVGIEPVPPLTFEDVAAAISCVFEGHALSANNLEPRLLARHDWTPLEPEIEPDQGWTLLAISIEALLARLTRPVSDAEPDEEGPGRAAHE